MQQFFKVFSPLFLSTLVFFACHGDETKLKKNPHQYPHKPQSIEEAFDHVVRNLHAPYDHGDIFFKKWDNNNVPLNIHVDGKKGSYSLKFLDPVLDKSSGTCSTTVSYTYDHYQAGDEHLLIHGKLELFEYISLDVVDKECSPIKEFDPYSADNNVRFRYKRADAVGDKYVLVISGDFYASLEFVIQRNPDNLDDAQLKIVFHYKGDKLEMFVDETFEQNVALWKKIWQVIKNEKK